MPETYEHLEKRCNKRTLQRDALLAACEKAESILDGPIASELTGDQCADLGLYDICNMLKAAIEQAKT